jgi:hypothetical protein
MAAVTSLPTSLNEERTAIYTWQKKPTILDEKGVNWIGWKKE